MTPNRQSEAEIRAVLERHFDAARRCDGTASRGCMRKIDGRWLIVHQHLSNPFDPMTMKADFAFASKTK